ncbi:MAG: 4'-phosphopantetheinyl transferase superfamily protein [Bacteroidota bacterium]
MPQHTLVPVDSSTAYGLWHIAESEEALRDQLQLTPTEYVMYQQITHLHRRLSWLAARAMLQRLCISLGYAYTGVLKNHWGQPYVATPGVYISLAHCFPWALAAVSKGAPIGIDIQLPSQKLYRVRHKYLSRSEIQDAAGDIEKLCVYWCAKEAIYKAYGGRGRLSLKGGIRVRPFVKDAMGWVQGFVNVGGGYVVRYRLHAGYVLAYAC